MLAVPVGALLLLRYAASPLLVGVAVALLLLAAWPGVLLAALLGRRAWLSSRPIREDRTAVIVLGAPVPGGEVGPELAARLRAGLDASVALGSSGAGDAAAASLPLVLTGGRGTEDRPPEAEAMADWVRSVSPGAPVIVEDRATTTEENLRLAPHLLSAQGIPPRYAVVTSAYHAPRTSLLARRQGLRLQVVGVPVPLPFAPATYLRELLILLKMDRVVQSVVAACVILGGLAAALVAS